MGGLQVQILEFIEGLFLFYGGGRNSMVGVSTCAQKVFSAALCGVSLSRVRTFLLSATRLPAKKKSIEPDQSRLNYPKRWFTGIGIVEARGVGQVCLVVRDIPSRYDPKPHLLADVLWLRIRGVCSCFHRRRCMVRSSDM